MSGKKLIIGFFVGLAIFTAGLWYFQTYAFYRELAQQPLVIGERTYPVAEWQGINATSSPLKLRACLKLSPETLSAISTEQSTGDGAEPLTAPGWFECFDAAMIGNALEAGGAAAYALPDPDADGIVAWLAIFPDGRAYKWHQLHPRFANQ